MTISAKFGRTRRQAYKPRACSWAHRSRDPSRAVLRKPNCCSRTVARHFATRSPISEPKMELTIERILHGRCDMRPGANRSPNDGPPCKPGAKTPHGSTHSYLTEGTTPVPRSRQKMQLSLSSHQAFSGVSVFDRTSSLAGWKMGFVGARKLLGHIRGRTLSGLSRWPPGPRAASKRAAVSPVCYGL